MSEHNLISVDLAKNVFQLCAMTDRMNIVFNRQLKRKDLARFMATQKPVEVVMEACYSSHYWGRCFAAMGHQVRLLPAQHVEIAMVPLGRMGGPGTFESAGDRITANAPASLVDPAQALFFNAGS
ncbi:MAG: hypothetical protein LJE92_15995, partial [Gammaproteobacteria bacterium]|nr:hypothetical protein [Gammaproteobacteria bacterium]